MNQGTLSALLQIEHAGWITSTGESPTTIEKQAAVDNTNPLAFGMSDKVDFFFENDPSFKLKPDAQSKGVRPVAWFDSDKPLRSGWGWGQGYLKDSVAVADAQVGKGRLFLFGPEVTYRGQPHGTFKFLFNGIYYGHTETVHLNAQ